MLLFYFDYLYDKVWVLKIIVILFVVGLVGYGRNRKCELDNMLL